MRVSKHKLFSHDCESCVYLGTIRIPSGWYPAGADIYYHRYTDPNGRGASQTVVVRYGNEGPEYTSGANRVFAKQCPEIAAALDLARKSKLLYECPFCGCLDFPIEEAPGEWASCPECKAV